MLCAQINVARREGVRFEQDRVLVRGFPPLRQEKIARMGHGGFGLPRTMDGGKYGDKVPGSRKKYS